MKNIFIILLFLAAVLQTNGQRIYEQYTKLNDSLRYGYGKNDFLPYGSRGYTLILPGTTNSTSGMILMLDDNKINLQDSSQKQYICIQSEANAKDFAVLYISTGIPVDFYFSESSVFFVDSVLSNVFVKYGLPNKNIFLLGAMVSGYRALKYIEFCKNGKSKFNPDIKGVVLSESSIDLVRQWYECQKQVRDHLSDIAFFEGNFITYLFKSNLKETPVTDIDKYIEASPYSYFDTKMKKSVLFKDLAIRAYTYADLDYWFSAPGQGVYDSNYPDMSGFINEQKLAGNKKSELIVFSGNPADKHKTEMRKQSSTWDLVDKKELMNWITNQAK
jgi:hypothetical protein